MKIGGAPVKTKQTSFILLTTLFLFVVLTVVLLTENAAAYSFNYTLYNPIAQLINPTLTTIAVWIGHLTHWYTYTLVILMLLIIPRTRVKIGLPMAITQLAAAIIGPVILKNIFAIERPDIN